MSTAEFINQNYDRNILLFIFTATLAVIFVVGLLFVSAGLSASWFLLPASWWVGGMMAWGFGKYQNKYQR